MPGLRDTSATARTQAGHDSENFWANWAHLVDIRSVTTILKLYERNLAMKTSVTHRKPVVAPRISRDAYYCRPCTGAYPTRSIPSRSKRLLTKLGDLPSSSNNWTEQRYVLLFSGVEFIVANTDQQALKNSAAPIKMQIGGSSPRVSAPAPIRTWPPGGARRRDTLIKKPVGRRHGVRHHRPRRRNRHRRRPVIASLATEWAR